MNYGVDLLVSGVLPVLQNLNYRLQRNNCRGNQQYCVVHFCILNSMFARLGTDYEINNTLLVVVSSVLRFP